MTEAGHQVLEQATQELARAERLLTVAAAAGRLNRSLNAVRRDYRRGHLPSVRVRSGGHLRVGIPISAVEAVLACPICHSKKQAP